MHFSNSIKIDSFIISKESKTFIIAEAGVNHCGDLKNAKMLIDCAVASGADAVKFQSFKTEHLILRNVSKAPYQSLKTSPDESQFDMLKKLEMTIETQMELKNYCKNRILFLSTPFDEYSLEEMDSLNLPAYKVSSTDITNLPFLRKVAQKGKPIILSTGMSCLEEIRMALEEIHQINKDVILLQCSAAYPIKDEEVNLRVLSTFFTNFDILIGYSDHSRGRGAAPYAVAMGARIIEKHFTINKNLSGPDHEASLSREEMKDLVTEIRRVETYIGSKIKCVTTSEVATRRALQKCLVAKRDIKKDELLDEKNVIAKRTGGMGISPINYKNVFGRSATKDYLKDEIIVI